MFGKKHWTLTSSLALLLLTGAAGSAAAQHPSGRVVPAQATALQPVSLFVPAGVSFTITTSNLVPVVSGGVADTVLHVQNTDANGSYFDGDDDGGPEYRSSKVEIPASSVDRNFTVVVRAYREVNAGTCNLNFVGSNGSSWTNFITFGGKYYAVGSFDALTHFWTGETALGTSDTVMLVLSGPDSHAIAYDDDDGVGNMSWIHSDQACTSGCAVIVGNYGSAAGAFETRLYWDGDIHYADNDVDGLGDSLEAVIGTNAWYQDTDFDGLTDAQEVLGIVEGTGTRAVKLPKYGADPLVRDIFVEVDWTACTDTTTCSDVDVNQMSGTEAIIAASLYPSDVHLHIDNGVANNDAATATIYGAWGGATRVPVSTGLFCGAFSPERVGLFHSFLATSVGFGGQGNRPGSCAYGGNYGATLAHELGHNLGIAHGGNTPSVTVNCKPNYRSFMNYAYVYRGDVGFSKYRFANQVLNPISLDENRGLGTTDSAVLTDMAGGIFKYKVDTSTGAIDWNRDGIFTSGTRGAPIQNWASGGCEHSWYHSDRGYQASTGASMAWVALSTPRLYTFSRRADGLIDYRFATNIDSCPAGRAWDQGCATWYPALSSAATQIANSQGAGAPASRGFIAGYTPSGEKLLGLLLVYRGTDDTLRFQVGTPNSTGMTFNNPAQVSTTVVGSDPELLDVGDGTLRLFARDKTSQVLLSWDYRLSTRNWSASRIELWSDGTQITVAEGVGVTRGYLGSLSGLQIVGAFPAVVTGGNQIETARFDASTGRWVRVGGWPGGRVPTGTKLSIAYEPYNKSASITLGRYYLTFTWVAGTASQIMMTEGNDLTSTATSRRYQWLGTTYFVNMWGNTTRSIPLLFDMDRDTNLRALYVFSDHNTLNFFPSADGIADLQLKDNDDKSYLRATIACSIGKGTCPPL